MGVRGLSSHISNNPDNFEPFELHQTLLLIDAQNFLNFVYFTHGLHTQFNGEYAQFVSCIIRLVSNFRRCSIRPIFVFDGCHEEAKLETQLVRCRNRLQTCRCLFNLIERPPTKPVHPTLCLPILPPLTAIVLAQTLQNLGVDVIVCDREADTDLASLAICLDCPVLSNDSDFYITVPECPNSPNCHFLPLSLISFEPRTRVQQCTECSNSKSSNKSSNCSYLTCYRFRPNGPVFGQLPMEQRPLFASLVGNDYIPQSTFLSVLPLPHGLSIPLTGKATKEMRKNRRKSLYKYLINWLSGFGSNTREPINRVLSRLPASKRAELGRKLYESLEIYRVSVPTVETQLIPYLNPKIDVSGSFGLDYEGKSEDPIQTTLCSSSTGSSVSSETAISLSCDENEILISKLPSPCAKLSDTKPKLSDITKNWSPNLLHAFRHFQLLPTLFDTIYSGGLVLNCAVESLNDSKSIYIPAAPVRQLVYSILLKHINPSPTNTTTLKEFYRKGSWTIKCTQLQSLTIIGDYENSHDIRFDLIHDFVTTSFSPMIDESWVNSLALLLSIWHSNSPGCSEDVHSCAFMTSFMAISIASYLLTQSRHPKLHQHFKRCSVHFANLCSSQSFEKLNLNVVHKYGEFQAVYAALWSLGTLLDTLYLPLSPECQSNRCINLPSAAVLFPSGFLFHSLTSYILTILPSNRITVLHSVVLPHLMGSDSSHASSLLTSLFTCLRTVRGGCHIRQVVAKQPNHHSSPEQINQPRHSKPNTTHASKKKKKSRKKRPVNISVPSMAELDAKIERIMIENDLFE